MELDSDDSCRPVPAPRRLYPELRKMDYENVTVELINKNLNINSENIHVVKNCTDKVPNNKIFLNSLSDQEDTSATTRKKVLTEMNDLYGPNANELVPVIYSTPTPAPRPRKPKNTDTQMVNEIYENTAPTICSVSSTSANSAATINAATSNNINSSKLHPELSPNSSAICKDTTDNAAEAASSTNRLLRKAPELPPKSYLSAEGATRASRHSITSEVSTTSYDLTDRNFNNTSTPKSASNATLNSSIADSADSAENRKFKSPSPGYVDAGQDFAYSHEILDPMKATDISVAFVGAENDNENSSESSDDCKVCTLSPSTSSTSTSCTNFKFHEPTNESEANELLKSLGSTSKLLTESIGERLANKTKGVRQKLDKNLKSSTEILSNISSDTSARLKNASKRFGTNFSKNNNKSTDHIPPQFHIDRPQTLPPNDRVFNSISFSSPLSRRVNGIENISSSSGDCSYEVPRNFKLAHSDLDILSPPSYEDALKSSAQQSFTRNASGSKSLLVPSHIAAEAASVALTKQRSNSNLQDVAEEMQVESSGSTSRDSLLDSPSPPMPNFPPPTLPKDVVASTENLYGKLKPIVPPARQRRRKNYEQIQLRRVVGSPTSLRPNVDSAELHQLNLEAAAAEREESMFLREQLLAAEAKTLKPDRSESWEYFEDSVVESTCSTPEPVYANEEATYGHVFEMATSIQPSLTPNDTLKHNARASDLAEGAVGGTCAQPPVEIIEEFDPLLRRKAATICNTDKSNQLLLLEHLLEEDVYGTVSGDQLKSDDDVSMCTSEEENTTATTSTTNGDISPQPLGAVAVLPKNSTPTPTSPTKINNVAMDPTNQIQIVHQNAQLRSDSKEDLLDEEERVRPYLSRVDENSASVSSSDDVLRNNENRAQWFVQDGKDRATKERVNPFAKLQIDGESPPSYLEAIGADGRPINNGNEQKSRGSIFTNTKNVFSNVKQRVEALTRKSSFKVPGKGSDVRVTLQMVPRPSLSPLLVRYEGPLVRFPSGVVEDILKEMQNRKAILRDRQFQTFQDMDMKSPKETIPLEYITTVQCVSNIRVTDNSTSFYCFEITTSLPKNHANNSAANVQAMSNPNLVMTSSASGNCKQQRVAHLYGVTKESERGVWMQKILESLTNLIPPKYVCNYYRAGWCYLKTSIAAEWAGAWLVLKKNKRRLLFVSGAMNVEKMDLRKARCIVLKDSDESIRNLHVESGPMLMIDCPPFTVYMIMASPRETKIWRHIIREVAHNNGFSLSDQQLTKFNVPVIVDKCINFVYIHGSMSEGIYRKSGSENSILKLLTAFRVDAFNVEVTRNEYNEHDVANVLKRFMRDLPERLMGKLSESFMCVTELEEATDKIQSYKELLVRLSVIERETLKKIVGHLAFISSQKAKNKMSIKNLTMIWGPTLLQNHQQQEEMIYSQKEADVLTDLITFHKNLFPLTPEEMKKEQEMLMCLQKYYAAAETLTDSVKKSGDLKIWITLNRKPENTNEEKTQVNVTISPTRTAYDVCRELASKMQMSTHQVSLHEVILNETLERPLHHETKVFDVILNWSYWPENDRKNNYLVVKPVDILREVQRAVKNLATVTPGKELKFADNRTKSMKSYQCELRDGKIVISKKDKNDKATIVREIFLQGATAYLGCEKKRDFPWSWAITFVECSQKQIMRSREAPYIGHVLAGSEWVDRTIWFSSIWYCLYGDSILPPAEIIMK